MSDLPELPVSPVRRLLGMTVVEQRFGFARIEYRHHPDHANMAGLLHGGVMMTLLDDAAGMAGYVTEEPGVVQRSVTVDMSVHFTGQSREPLLYATGEVVRRGRSLFFARSEIRDTSGNLLAFGASAHRLRSDSSR
jgi:uncharacterized protein (TIGR00369 family)